MKMTPEIAAEVEIDLSLLPVQRMQVWFPLDETGVLPAPSGWAPTAEGPSYQKPSLWAVAKPPPGSDGTGHIVLAIFSDADEVRVYASPTTPGKTPRRYVLSKHAPLIGIETMSPEVLQEEIVGELYMLTGEDPDEDDTPETPEETPAANGATAPTEPAPPAPPV